MKPTLTKKQENVLSIIKQFLNEAGYPPTIRELADLLGFTGPKAAQKHLFALEKKGYIERTAKKTRSIKLLDTLQKKGLPIIGSVAAGRPILSEEHIEGFFSFPSHSPENKDYFLLKVTGESMIDAYINDGDLVLIKFQPCAENSDIIVAMVNGEVTLKRFFKKNDHIILKPENQSMTPIIVEKNDDFKIIGKVEMVVRTVS
ncbi:MAG: transcriptional repressor LexA [Candidatus Ancaeobacter aquaticus]|nr:transcriptional repressor LexA [Candidatus Ancaeobacter aquaticus]